MGFEDIFCLHRAAKISILGDYYQAGTCVCLLEDMFSDVEAESTRTFAHLIKFTTSQKSLISPKTAERLTKRIDTLRIIENGQVVKFDGISQSIPFIRVKNGIEPVILEGADYIIWQLDSENGFRLNAGHSQLHSIKPNHAIVAPKGTKISLIPHTDNDQFYVAFLLRRSGD
jgi:hypothetical protein